MFVPTIQLCINHLLEVTRGCNWGEVTSRLQSQKQGNKQQAQGSYDYVCEHMECALLSSASQAEPPTAACHVTLLGHHKGLMAS